jgi:polar amino acid transport system substrate-binding protein
LLAIERSFHIVGTPQVPYKFLDDKDGLLHGIDIDIVKIVMEELAIPYNISLISSGSRIIKESKKGSVDMVLSFSYKEDRDYLVYPKNSYIKVAWNFFIKKSNLDKILYNNLTDLKGWRVGATQDWSYTSEFWEAGLDLKIIPNDQLQLLKLYRGRIDTVPLNTTSALYEIKKLGLSDSIVYLPKPLKSKSYFNAFVAASDYPNKKEIMERYDEIISRISADGTIQEVFDKYLK